MLNLDNPDSPPSKGLGDILGPLMSNLTDAVDGGLSSLVNSAVDGLVDRAGIPDMYLFYLRAICKVSLASGTGGNTEGTVLESCEGWSEASHGRPQNRQQDLRSWGLTKSVHRYGSRCQWHTIISRHRSNQRVESLCGQGHGIARQHLGKCGQLPQSAARLAGHVTHWLGPLGAVGVPGGCLPTFPAACLREHVLAGPCKRLCLSRSCT